MRATNSENIGKALELSTTATEVSTVGSGIKTECMEGEFSTMLAENLHMRENGSRISFRAMASFTTKR